MSVAVAAAAAPDAEAAALPIPPVSTSSSGSTEPTEPSEHSKPMAASSANETGTVESSLKESRQGNPMDLDVDDKVRVGVDNTAEDKVNVSEDVSPEKKALEIADGTSIDRASEHGEEVAEISDSDDSGPSASKLLKGLLADSTLAGMQRSPSSVELRLYISKMKSDGFVVLVSDCHHVMEWPRALLPRDCRQGDVLSFSLTRDSDASTSAGSSMGQIQELLRKVSSDDS